ncbi:FAS1-like dehydratase domain-containing protein [Micromonospora chokoriensis]|uniref:FAS1-like dehydratase domain-containing protein n=1 Tax=Micromonospora chokoriensis TaxID=356851 RepID=UPI0004C39332|nr:MaoC family dehydratase N-terminal domain-containing protein [Micromonospora chokoriensis]
MQTFEQAVAEFISRSEELLDKESPEDRPVPHPGPLNQDETPVPSLFMLTPELIRRYAHAIGDDNPLYVDPEYARRSWLGSQTVPGTVLIHVRYPGDHGAQRERGYPVANFLSGVAWEFYDVLRPGMRFTSSKKPRELVTSRGRQSSSISHHSETFYWNNSERLMAKAYGRLLHLPVKEMLDTRVMPVDQLGQPLFYRHEPYRYTPAEVDKLLAGLDSETRRGSEPLLWESVTEGQELPSIAQPPYSMFDELLYPALDHGLDAGFDGAPPVRAFRPGYLRARESPDFARTHPVTRWPYAPEDEHEDRFLAPYRCEPMPFDFGIQRSQLPIRLLTNWAGDHGFVHRLYTSMRMPVFYGDAVVFSGKVIRKYVADRTDQSGRIVRYGAVAIELVGTNQRDEVHCLGYATVFLPSAEHGRPQLPVPHADLPDYVPFDVHRRSSWY